MKRDIVLDDYCFYDEFVAIFGMGLIKCLQENIISIDDAENWLFMHYNVKQLKAGKFSKDVQLGVDLGTELYVCMDTCSQQEIEQSIQDIYKLFADFVKKNVKEKPSTLKHIRGVHVKKRKRSKVKISKNSKI